MTDITAPIFTNEDKARAYLEAQRWPDGPFCAFCGQFDTVRALPPKGSMGKGWYHCRECRKKFTVRVGTLYERSHVPLHKWLLATHLLCASKKGMSAHQLHRMLGVTYKTAWFMAHRIRESMRESNPEPMGGGGSQVEVDETYWGNRPRRVHKHRKPGRLQAGGMGHKEKIITLVERGGRARSFHVAKVNSATIQKILGEQLYRDTTLNTDEANFYKTPGKEFHRHATVNHGAREYVRGDATTNHVENYFSILKRGLTGVYQHVSATHLKRYLSEFDFRYSTRELTDTERTIEALKGIEGKRLTYRRIGFGQASAEAPQ